MALARTGLELLNERLGGGFDRPSTILLFSDHPSEKRVFAEQFLYEGLRDGERCLYVDFFRAPHLARRVIRQFGEFSDERLVFVDATSAQLLLPTTERYTIREPDNLDHIMDTVERAIREAKPTRVVIDSMEFLTDRFPKDDVFRRWRQLVEVARAEGAVVAYLFLNWVYGQAEVQRINDMSDYIVEFQSQMRSGVLQNYLRIRHNRPEGVETNWIPYTFNELVGLRVYFPRILVTGPRNVGKSTVVRTLCDDMVTVDRMGTTLAFDSGNVQASELEAQVFVTPGKERLEAVLQMFAREVNGIMLVVDSSRPEDLETGRQMANLVGQDTPLVVLANKSDLPDAMSPDRVREGLDLPPDVPVIPAVATEGQGLLEALNALAEMIVGVR